MSKTPFVYHNEELHLEAVSLRAIAEAVGTPVYIYSQDELMGRAAAYRDSLATLTTHGQVCYAIKANGNLALLKLLAQMGLGADVTSGGELFLALQAGFPPEKIVYSGVGKRRDEIILALENHIQALHVESAQELEVIGELAAARQQLCHITLRLNPDVPADTHPYISTGGKTHKFGVNADTLIALAHQITHHPWLTLSGLAMHIGSQITRLEPYGQAGQILLQLAETLRQQGIPVSYLDVGGGLGIDYALETNVAALPAISEWVKTVVGPVAAAGYGVLIEPGRSIVGPAGVLLTQVLYTKQQGSHTFIITDAGMNDLIRPALYQAQHPLLPVRPRSGEPILADVVGPVCETGDILARARSLSPLQPGDYLAILQAGAYGFAMSSNYNGRLRPAEVLVQGDKWGLVRGREQYTDLVRHFV